ERDGAADRAGIGAEAALPETVADDRDGRRLRLFLGREAAAERRLGAEQREEIGGDDLHGYLLGLVPVRVVHLVERDRRHVAEHGVLRAEILEIEVRERQVAGGALLGGREEQQRPRIADRQRPQQQPGGRDRDSGLWADTPS